MRTYFEDLEVGYRSRVGSYVLSADEIVGFARRWDPQPFHVDEEAARRSLYKGLTASSLHLFAICTRLFFDHPDRIAVLAMLGKDEIRFPHPARPGDELGYDTECIEARASRSKPDCGIVTLADTVENQRGETVLTQKVTLLVARRPS
ncbi:MAG: MaoC family dehydratase [Proteobacteria bacterium]|nr:MaoC family dehydratase [Pseudomonadota bacterium]